MAYKLTEQAKQSPLLLMLPSGEYVGVGAEYVVNSGASCGSCNAEQKAVFEKRNAGKPKRSYREALPHEYEIIAKQYEKSGGIPGYLIIVPDEPKPQAPKPQTTAEKQ